MSYAVSQPRAKPRPAVVSSAVYLLWGVVAAQLLGVVLGVLPNEQRDRALDEFRAAHPEMPDTSGLENATLVVGIVVAVIIAIGLAVLAYFVGRGSQPARVTTWVLAGLTVLCTGCGVIAAQAPSLLAGDTPEAELQREYFEIMQANTPAWLTAASMALNVLILLALIAVVILLATPAANEYFRKEQEVWVPPSDYSGGGWPGSTPPAGPPTQ